ncbi:SCNM1 protein, partial [Locustella ochotensis]|nr:SCNM1 protein [Locustella ochotensis]
MIPKTAQEPSQNSRNPETPGPTHGEGETPPKFQGISRNSPFPECPQPLLPPPGVPKERRSGRKGNSQFSKGSGGNSGVSQGPSPERLRILRHHLHLRSRGWLQDPAGKWVKDENAEFDSDEEEPPPLPPA